MKNMALIFAGYLLGSIPFAFLMAKLFARKDVRFEGDGNVGTRNALHVAGWGAGGLTALLDGGKGAAAYWVGKEFGSGDLALYLTALGLMLGHGYPIWLRWRGGKGLAAAVGFLSQMWPLAVLIAAIAFLLARALVSSFDLSFATGSAAFLFATAWQGNDAEGLLFIVLLLGMAGVKRLLDLPYERAVKARGGSVEGIEEAQAAHHPRI